MTKQYLEAFAAEIKAKFGLDRPWAEVHLNTQSHALSAVAVVCKVANDFNPKFDERRFRAACGVFTN